MAYHSIIFGEGDKIKNTWKDWHLIPASPPVVALPTPAFKFVDIPGRSGSLDFSDFLVGHPTYGDRSGAFTFYAAIDDPITGETVEKRSMHTRKQEVAKYLNGQSIMKMTLEDDKDYYYVGRFYLKEWTPGASFATVSIEYRVKPYKYDSTGKEVIG